MMAGGKLQKTRVKVIYCSKTGNTKKVAEAIADEMKTEAIEAAAVGSGYDMKKCDLIFVGSGNYKSAPEREMIEFLKAIVPAEDRYAAVFGTAGGSNKGHLSKMKEILEEKEVRVLDEWCCPGQEYELKNKGRPNEEDLKKARDFARKTLRKIEVL